MRKNGRDPKKTTRYHKCLFGTCYRNIFEQQYLGFFVLTFDRNSVQIGSVSFYVIFRDFGTTLQIHIQKLAHFLVQIISSNNPRHQIAIVKIFEALQSHAKTLTASENRFVLRKPVTPVHWVWCNPNSSLCICIESREVALAILYIFIFILGNKIFHVRFNNCGLISFIFLQSVEYFIFFAYKLFSLFSLISSLNFVWPIYVFLSLLNKFHRK